MTFHKLKSVTLLLFTLASNAIYASTIVQLNGVTIEFSDLHSVGSYATEAINDYRATEVKTSNGTVDCEYSTETIESTLHGYKGNMYRVSEAVSFSNPLTESIENCPQSTEISYKFVTKNLKDEINDLISSIKQQETSCLSMCTSTLKVNMNGEIEGYISGSFKGEGTSELIMINEYVINTKTPWFGILKKKSLHFFENGKIRRIEVSVNGGN
ncbi:MAG: hypothetical protein GY787_26930 [Alteromonadales bacterium]|nr:hypothetical protein [Alteromonadales bacterium]